MNTVQHYRPYERATLDMPLAHFLLEPFIPVLLPVIQAIFRFRWFLTRPLEIPLLPKWLPGINGSFLGHFYMSDLLLALPVAFFLWGGYMTTFISPSVEASGTWASYAIYLTFLTANKANSLYCFLFGIPFERMLPHHLLASVLAVTLGVFHTYVAYVYGDDDSGDSGDRLLFATSTNSRELGSGDSQFALNGNNPDLKRFLMDGGTNFSGSMLVICMIVLVGTSFFRIIRKYLFELWLLIHVGFAIGVIYFCLAHDVGSILFVAIWWAIDAAVRYLVMALCKYPTRATIRKCGCDVVEVRFEKPKSFDYNPGQFVQVMIPSVGVLQFHPISISSAPHEDEVTLHIRALGGWSKKLLNLAEAHENAGEEDHLISIMIEGPYGSLAIDIDDHQKYKHVLLVCGGIGVTHCQSVGKAIQYQCAMEGRPLKKMRMIWATRSEEMVRDIPPLHDDAMDEVLDGTITKEVYYTGKTDISEDPLPENLMLVYGRPNLDAIFQDMVAEAKEDGDCHVAVFGCGPDLLMHHLQRCCHQYSPPLAGLCSGRGGVTFDFHKETFNF